MLNKGMYKRNKQETYAWLLVATRLSLPNEMVMRVCDYLFDAMPCDICGKLPHNHNDRECLVKKFVQEYNVMEEASRQEIARSIHACFEFQNKYIKERGLL